MVGELNAFEMVHEAVYEEVYEEVYYKKSLRTKDWHRPK